MINCRAYRGIEDGQSIRDLLDRSFAATRHPYLAIDPPNWERLSAALRLGTSQGIVQLWEEQLITSCTTIGLLKLDPKRLHFSILADPSWATIGIKMVDWVNEQYGAGRGGNDDEGDFICSVCESNRTQKSILASRGYVQGKKSTFFRQKDLDGPLKRASLPSGMQTALVRDLGADRFRKRAASESKVFGGRVSADFLQIIAKSPLYRPELDLIITAPDRTIAAFCTIWLDAENSVGIIEPVATMPEYRQFGLAKALMIEAFRGLQAAGASLAFLGHDAANRAGKRLYESLKMPIMDEEYLWRRDPSQLSV